MPEASPELGELLKQASALRQAGNTQAKVMATLMKRLVLLGEVSRVCRDHLEPRLTVVRVMVALTDACRRDEDFFTAVYPSIDAGRALIRAFPASPAAYQVFAAGLDQEENWGATPERRGRAHREKMLALDNCRELDPQAHCSVP